MLWLIILILILFITIVVVSYIVFKSVWKTIGIASSFLTIIIIIFSIFLVKDVNDLRTNFATEPKMFLLEENGDYLTGFVTEEFGEIQDIEGFDASRLSNFKNKDLDFILGANYKLFVIDMDWVETNLPEDLDTGDLKLTKADVLSIFRSDSPSSIIVDRQIENLGLNKVDLPEESYDQIKQNVIGEFGNEKDIKAVYFGMSFGAIIQDNGPMILIDGLKDDDLIIYPETLTFSLAKIIPKSIFESIAGNLMLEVELK